MSRRRMILTLVLIAGLIAGGLLSIEVGEPRGAITDPAGMVSVEKVNCFANGTITTEGGISPGLGLISPQLKLSNETYMPLSVNTSGDGVQVTYDTNESLKQNKSYRLKFEMAAGQKKWSCKV